MGVPALASTAAWSAGGRAAAATGAPSEPMRLSVLSYSFRGLLAEGKMDVFGYLETCKYRYHLGAADIWTGNKGFLMSTDEGYIRKVRDGLDERELVLADLAVDYAQLWMDDPAQREKYYQNGLAHLKANAILGAKFVRIDAGGDRKKSEWTGEQFDYIVKRYREYAQFAYDHGFKVGAENHWGPEAYWPSMQKLYKAVDHRGFGISCHFGGWAGSPEEKDAADREAAPWVCHTHIPWNITEGPLAEKMGNLRKAGYQGYYSVEHHSAKQEYAEVGLQLARVRAVLQNWREGGTGEPSGTRPRQAK
ncbi:MAG: sugar phosphate isomerase/epimerase family protein [Bryobacteraceae bacterium]